VPQRQNHPGLLVLEGQERRLGQDCQANLEDQALLAVPENQILQDYRDCLDDQASQQRLLHRQHHMLIIRIILLRKPGLLTTPEG